ncbi:MAG: hypothetical protein HYZ84_02340, partial [Candidatus Omnitrophica bacterium]|nr:hypothetical protein [Candidatus Omnitrophota bacterium]
LKTIAVAYQVSLEGLKLTWDELVKLTGAGVPVLVNIEERHFAVVTSVANGLVTFKENGYTRVKSETEFKARWFSSLGSSSNQGAALVETGYNANLLTAGVDHTLTAKELLKVKGAGWFKKLFKKIVKFFQKVVDAIVKIIQKVMAAITKAFVAVFGKTIGGALAGIVNSIINILTFPVHVAYYASHGDWKGLMKYMGQTLLQVAMIAVQFIPGVGQALGALFQMLGNFIQAIGATLVNFATQTLGQGLLGTLVNAVGSVISNIGTSLVNYGVKLANGSNSFLSELKTSGFGAVKNALKNGISNLINKLNPVTYYQTLAKSVTESLKQLGFKNSLSKLLDWSKEQFVSNIIQKKIDQSLEKSKMNSFFKSVISTVSSAAVQGISSAIVSGTSSFLSQAAVSLGLRAPPTGGPRILQYPGDEAFYVYGQDGRPSEVMFGGAPVDFGGFDSGSGLTYGYKTDENGIPLFAYRLGTGEFNRQPEITFDIRTNPDGISWKNDGGDIFESRIDPVTGKQKAPKEISNLEEKPSFYNQLNSLRYGAADYLTERNNQFSNFVLDEVYGASRLRPYLGATGSRLAIGLTSPGALSTLLGREYVNGLIDTLRVGDQLAGIKSDFFNARASFQNGDYFDAAKGLGSAGLKGLTEGGRILNIVAGFAGTVKGVGQLGKVVRNADRFEDVVRVFRVEGGGSKVRFDIDDIGNVNLRSGDQSRIFLNFGEEKRAIEFLGKRGSGAEVKEFYVPKKFLEKIQRDAVPEIDARLFPKRPIQVDTTKAPNQFGIPKEYFEELLDEIIKKSGRIFMKKQ